MLAVLVVGASDGGADPTSGRPASRSKARRPSGRCSHSGRGGTLGTHFCTGSVVHSPEGDVVLTAAHCLTGRAPGTIAFVPAYRDGEAPYGVWTVSRVYVDGTWTANGSTDHDFAFLVVSRTGAGSSLEALTGAERLGVDAPSSRRFDVVGYPDLDDAPVGCVDLLLLFSPTQLQFDCGGYTDGVSGSPLVAGLDPVTGVGTVVGVIGGYEQGGDTPSISYNSAVRRQRRGAV